MQVCASTFYESAFTWDRKWERDKKKSFRKKDKKKQRVDRSAKKCVNPEAYCKGQDIETEDFSGFFSLSQSWKVTMSRSAKTPDILLILLLLIFPTNFAKTTGLLSQFKQHGGEPKARTHHLQKRTYDFSGFDWASYLDGLYSPKGLPNQAAISTSLNGFRTISYIASGKGNACMTHGILVHLMFPQLYVCT